MAGNVDTSRLLGVDALLGAMRGAWADLGRVAADLGPEVLLAALLAALYVLLYILVSRAVRFGLRRALRRQHLPPPLRRVLRIGLRLTVLMLALVSITALFPQLGTPGPAIFRTYLLLLGLLLLRALLHRALHLQAGRWKLDASLTLLLNNVVRGLWVALGLYLVLAQFGINLLPILGGLGVVGLAVGFAAQDILANLISGVTLLLDRPFRIGDWVRTGDHEGQVCGLTLRTTRLRTRDNEHVSIPNKDVAGSVVVNLSHGGKLRLNVPVSIAYRERVEDARRALLPVMAAHPKVLRSPAPVVLVRDLEPSAVRLILRCWVTEKDIASYPVITMQLLEAAKGALQTAGLAAPYPQVQVSVGDVSGLRDVLAVPAQEEGRPPEP